VLISPSVFARERRPPIHYESEGPFKTPPWSEAGDEITSSKPTRGRQPAIPHRSGQPSAAPPWSEPRGYSPPQPRGRAGADADGTSQENFDEHTEGRLARPESRDVSGGGHHPTGRRTYVVQAGDCLWTIAAEWLETDDVRRIARYWPRIHRANRATIGRDPNVIHPGQVLVMPDEKTRVSGAGH
jgi:nucleoid-associated protein YgaU